jgi:HTH-type transcriptional regulator/antitoxin MqsA
MNPRNYPDVIESAESGRPLRRGVKMLTIEVDGQAFTYGQPGWWASLSDPADNEAQLVDEDNVVRAAARREARAKARHSTLTPLVIRAIRESCGLSQREAARVFGGGPKAFEKYESGEVAPSSSMTRLLMLAAKRPELFQKGSGASTTSEGDATLLRETVWKSSVEPIYERIYGPIAECREPARSRSKIALLPYERRALEDLSRKFGLDRNLIVAIAEDLERLRRLFDRIMSHPVHDFRAGRVVVMGLINHAHCLLVGGLQAVAAGNPAVWSNCVRGLIGTFGAGVLISERPGSVPRYLEHADPGRLYAAAERVCSGLRDDVKRLHQIVHPSSGAIYAANTSVDAGTRTGVFEFGLRPPSPEGVRQSLTFLGNLATLIADRFDGLVANNAVLSTGKIIMTRVKTA